MVNMKIFRITGFVDGRLIVMSITATDREEAIQIAKQRGMVKPQ